MELHRLNTNEIIVYDSNSKGIPDADHDAKFFKKFQITFGRSHGLDNNTYGIPTKDANFKVLPIERIQKYVRNFIEDTKVYPEKIFLVTAIGTGLAGYKAAEIAPLFEGTRDLKNVFLPEEFWEILNEKENK